MRFVDHIYDYQVVDHMTLKVILPEGATNVRLSAPYDVTRSPDHKHYTYLDTSGRTVVTAHKTDLVEGHIQDFEVSHNFSNIYTFLVPITSMKKFIY